MTDRRKVGYTGQSAYCPPMVGTAIEATEPSRGLCPAVPVLVAGRREACWLSPDGEIETLDLKSAARRAAAARPMVCHGPAMARRLGVLSFARYELLELYAFVLPARFCLPTPRGLAAALGLTMPQDLEGEALTLFDAADMLLDRLAATDDRDAVAVATAMAQAGWPWGPAALAALGAPQGSDGDPKRGLKVWRRLPEWQDDAPSPPSGNQPVEPREARQRLATLLGTSAEDRPQQADFASAACAAFQPRSAPDQPNVVLSEAGTGTGKTLGYIAPASLWAEKNGGTVWISTYTRNLQRQIDGELARLYPDAAQKAAKVVIRKGRENYLCLLNMEEAVNRVGLMTPPQAIGLGLLARWALRTRDGDLGGDLPAWLPAVTGGATMLALADRRGECIYSACPHYGQCFIEHSVRRARHADLVIANHALVMIQAALGGLDDGHLPTRYVFDEGHHLFDAADSAFAGHLTGRETADLRRWLLGPEARSRDRSRGLKERVGDLVGDDEDAAAALTDILAAARALPGPGWANRVADGAPQGPAEVFLTEVRAQVYARTRDSNSPYDLETETTPLSEELAASAAALHARLAGLVKPMTVLASRLTARLDDDADRLETSTRARIEAICRSLQRRGAQQVTGWRSMLEALAEETPESFADWFAIERHDRRDVDVGLYRHWVDPMVPFANAVAKKTHGMLVTSATLADGTGDLEADWAVAEQRTGAAHLPVQAVRAQVASPFDYANLTRVLVVTDVRKDAPEQVAAAYRELFKAAGGGALGLFTAISRLRMVHGAIAGPLEDSGLTLYAQHLDGMDVATLIDIFRAETDSCLLGTDAVRDGVDVPGRSLRLLVFDRVPWPRPSLLHKARQAAFGRSRYVDMLTRLRLAQAYGRLVRRRDDKGVFVLLDRMFPSRLQGAFPDGVIPERVGLAQAVEIVGSFLPDMPEDEAGP